MELSVQVSTLFEEGYMSKGGPQHPIGGALVGNTLEKCGDGKRERREVVLLIPYLSW